MYIPKLRGSYTAFKEAHTLRRQLGKNIVSARRFHINKFIMLRYVHPAFSFSEAKSTVHVPLSVSYNRSMEKSCQIRSTLPAVYYIDVYDRL